MGRSRMVGVSAHPKNIVIKLDKDVDTFDCAKYQSCIKSINSCNKSCKSYKPYAPSRNVVKDMQVTKCSISKLGDATHG